MKLSVLLENSTPSGRSSKMFKTKEEIFNFLVQHQGDDTLLENDFKIKKDLSVSFSKSKVSLHFGKMEYIPFNISKVSKNLKIKGANLKSIEGLPTTINGTLSIVDCNSLSDLTGCPKLISGMLNVISCKNLKSVKGVGPSAKTCVHIDDCKNLEFGDALLPATIEVLITNCPKLTSLSKFDKVIRPFTTRLIVSSWIIKGNVLSLLSIEGLKEIEPMETVKDKENHWTSILNKYLPEGDIFDCQEDLVVAGFKEFAKL